MSCTYETELTAFVDGELDEVASRKLEAHLGGCHGCRAREASLRAAVMEFARLPAFEPSPRLRRGVMARLEAPTWSERLRAMVRVRWWVPAGALAAGAFAVAVLVTRPTQDAEGTQPSSPVQLELAQNLDLLRDLDLVGLEE